MVIDVGYLKRVTKRLLTLVLSLVRNISCFQNGCILHAIFDWIYYCNNGRAYCKMVCKKDKDTKKTKCGNCTYSCVCNNCRYFGMGNYSTYR